MIGGDEYQGDDPFGELSILDNVRMDGILPSPAKPKPVAKPVSPKPKAKAKPKPKPKPAAPARSIRRKAKGGEPSVQWGARVNPDTLEEIVAYADDTGVTYRVLVDRMWAAFKAQNDTGETA